MKTFKKLAVVMLAVMVLFTMTVPAMAASSSPAKQTFTTATLKKKTATYTGKNKKPAIKTVKMTKKNGKKVTLKAGKDYKVVYPKNMKKAGTYKIKIKGIGKYSGYTKTLTYTIKPAKQKVTVSKSTISVSKKSVKKKAYSQTVKVTKKAGKVTWTSSNPKAVKVSKKGKITVVKGAPKGTYTVKVTVKAANYKKVTKTIKVRVK